MSARLMFSLVAAVLIGAILLPIQAFGEPQPLAAASSRTPATGNPGGPMEADSEVAVCSSAPRGSARCHAHVRTDSKLHGRAPASLSTSRPRLPDPGAPQPDTGALGNGGAYDPAYLQSAYDLTDLAATAGGGHTVALVDAYDAPTAEADLAVYRSRFGLAPCTTANGCFRKVTQTGSAGPYPAADASWAQEVSIDLDMVSAICPNCRILLVEASSNTFADLGAPSTQTPHRRARRR